MMSSKLPIFALLVSLSMDGALSWLMTPTAITSTSSMKSLTWRNRGDSILTHEERSRKRRRETESTSQMRSTATDNNSQEATADEEDGKPLIFLPPGARPSLLEIESHIDFDEFVEGFRSEQEQADDRLGMIYFHASWCKSCAKFRHKMDRFAVEMADWVEAKEPKRRLPRLQREHSSSSPVLREGVMRLASLEWSANKALCQKLNVDKLPTVLFVRRGQVLDQFECAPSKFRKVQDAARHFLQQEAVTSSMATTQDLQQGQDFMQSLLDANRISSMEHQGVGEESPPSRSRLANALLNRMRGGAAADAEPDQ